MYLIGRQGSVESVGMWVQTAAGGSRCLQAGGTDQVGVSTGGQHTDVDRNGKVWLSMGNGYRGVSISDSSSMSGCQ